MNRAKKRSLRQLRASLLEKDRRAPLSSHEREVHGQLEEEIRELQELEAEMRTILPAGGQLSRFQRELTESHRYLSSWLLLDATKYVELAWNRSEELTSACSLSRRLREVGEVLETALSGLPAELEKLPVASSLRGGYDASSRLFYESSFAEASATLDVVESIYRSWRVCSEQLLVNVRRDLSLLVSQGRGDARLGEALENLIEGGQPGLASRLLEEMMTERSETVSERSLRETDRFSCLATRTERVNQTLLDWTLGKRRVL